MRIATYNIHRAIGRDLQKKPERIAAVLRELDADLVALQEVGYEAGRPGNVLEYLGDAMEARVIEGVTLLDEQGNYGNAILTRLPVSSLHLHDISVDGREPRGAIELKLEVNSIEFQIIATHLGLRPGERRQQIERLTSLLNDSPANIKILLGDLNEWFLWGRPLRSLYRLFGRTPSPPTFPARWPWFALDRIWVQPLVVLEALQVHKSVMSRQASDHLPLIAELRINE
ncbi:MAG: endonuclease/exonuclease/phosphatase family protein [Gammaproteobacteria bacterium]|jgi:endonuclease/exonuclease/phosphatase family metal-dependent hydrolase